MGAAAFTLHTRYDVVIVGARCAGAAAAMLLARAGASVLVVDRQEYGADTLSTHVLMRPAVFQLARWGILPALRGAEVPLIQSTCFHYGNEVVAVPINADEQVPGLFAPRRTLLDRLLVDAARAAGAEVRHGLVMQDLLRDWSGRVSGVCVRDRQGQSTHVQAAMVVGADGIGSSVARAAGAQILRRGSVSAATIYSYFPNRAPGEFRWCFRPGMAAGAIPTNGGATCAFVSVPTHRFDSEIRHDLPGGYLTLLRMLLPDLAQLADEQGFGGLRTFRGVPGFARKTHGPGWALVGDAGFFRDPLTSHGISDAFRDAEGVVQAILAGSEGDFQRYQEERDALAYPILQATDAIAAFDWTLSELPDRHKRLSAAMKAEMAVLSARSSERIARVQLPRFDHLRGRKGEFA